MQQDSTSKLKEVDVYSLQRLGAFTILHPEAILIKNSPKLINGYVKIVISKNFLSQDYVNFQRLL